MDNTLLSVLIGLGVAIVFGAIVFFKYKFSPKETDKQAANDFLELLRDELYDLVLQTIIDFDYTKYSNIADLEIEVINSVTETCKKCINDELADSKDMLSVLILKCLDSGMIEEFINKIIKEFGVEELVENKISEMVEEKYDAAIAEDEEISAKFNDSESFNEVEMDELPAAEEEKVPEEVLKTLNPQVEEEESYNEDDDSMEVLDDDLYYDAKGRLRSKSTGKYVKVQ
jgi:hypothetical protein